MKICPEGAELFDADGRTDGETDRYYEPIKVALRYFTSIA